MKHPFFRSVQSVLVTSLISCALFACNGGDKASEKNPASHSEDQTHVETDTHVTWVSTLQEELENPFDQKYTFKNSLEGKWKVYGIGSSRRDPEMQLLKELVNGKAELTFEMIDRGEGSVDTNLEVFSNPCKVTLKFRGKYCCSDMLMITLVEDLQLTDEDPSGCAPAIFGQSSHDLARGIIGALLKSSKSSNPASYHFTYSKNQDRIRLQNPVPPKKWEPIKDLETELHLIQEQLSEASSP